MTTPLTARQALTVEESVGGEATWFVDPPPEVGRHAAATGLSDEHNPDARAVERLLVDGAAFILDEPSGVPAIWGSGLEVLWASGESLLIVGPAGVGKTTLAGQIVRALLGLETEVLGLQVAAAAGRVLYLAVDRPRQAARSLQRQFGPEDRATLTQRLRVWAGPPPTDLAGHPELLTRLAQRAGASVVVLDSLKDAAMGLSQDDVAAAYNRARQLALAAGIEVLELHHLVKRGPNGAAPTTLADVYGSTWITAGAGSVVLLWGDAGDSVVSLVHLKQPAGVVGPFQVVHDRERGTSSRLQTQEPLAALQAAGTRGMTAQDLAGALFGTTEPDRVQSARRRLDQLVESGAATKTPDRSPGRTGGKPRVVYRAITAPITPPEPPMAITPDASAHAFSVDPDQSITQAITPITDLSNHARPPSFRRGRVSPPMTAEAGDDR